MKDLGKLVQSLVLSTALATGIGGCATAAKYTNLDKNENCTYDKNQNVYFCFKEMKGVEFVYAQGQTDNGTPLCGIFLQDPKENYGAIFTDLNCDDTVEVLVESKDGQTVAYPRNDNAESFEKNIDPNYKQMKKLILK